MFFLGKFGEKVQIPGFCDGKRAFARQKKKCEDHNTGNLPKLINGQSTVDILCASI